MSLYNADGQINLTVVPGTSFTGIYATDGSWNIVINDGSTNKGYYHPCGAINAVVVTDPSSPYYASNGSVNVIANNFGSYGFLTPNGGASSAIFNLTRANTANIRAAWNGGSGNLLLPAVGDSTLRGQSAGVGTAQAVNSWVMQLAPLLRASSINAGANNVFADGGSWGQTQNIANFLTGDGRVAVSGATALGPTKGPGGNAFNWAATGTLTFTPQDNCDTAIIWWRDGATGRNFNWSVDGGSTTAVNSTNVTQLTRTTVALGSAAAHSLALAWVLGSITIEGIHAYNSALGREISLLQWGICGATSTSLNDNTDSALGRLAVIGTVKPAGVLYEGGIINSWRTSISVATTKSDMTTFVQTVRANNGDPILVTPVFDPGSTGNAAIQDQYVTAMYEVASEQSCALFDIRKLWRSNANAVAQGWQPNGDVHPTTAGYAYIAAAIKPVLQYALAP